MEVPTTKVSNYGFNGSVILPINRRRNCIKRYRQNKVNVFKVMAMEKSPTRLVTFIGKGGAGKTTCAVLAAKFYASLGLKTCLVLQTQDPTAEFLLGQKLKDTPTPIGNDTLQAFRLESSKMLLEPFQRLKKADATLNLSQGVLDEIAIEELGVLPGMDSLIAVGALENLTQFSGGIKGNTKDARKKFDMVIYDGMSSDEILRMVGAAEKSRWYMKHVRSLAEKTDLGRLTAPSLLRLAETSVKMGGASTSDAQSTAELWDAAEQLLKKGSSSVADPLKFSCYLVLDHNNLMSVNAALRYWGCAIQAGSHVAGAFYHASKSVTEKVRDKFSPLDMAGVPLLSMDSLVNWDDTLNSLSVGAKKLLEGTDAGSTHFHPVTLDQNKKTVKLFLPGFDKSEIKLSQLKGGSALLIDAGDQRRSIALPSIMRGKVVAAKFENRSLLVTLK